MRFFTAAGFQDWLNEISQRLGSTGLTGGVVGCLYNVLLCFFGYRFYRVLIAVGGFLLGGFGGYFLLSNYTHLDSMKIILLALVIGALIALAAYALYQVGIFLLVLATVFFVLETVFSNLKMDQTTLMVIAGVAAVICAILAVKYIRPIMILSTGLAGGQAMAKIIGTAFGYTDARMLLILGTAVGVLGIWYQFAHTSKAE